MSSRGWTSGTALRRFLPEACLRTRLTATILATHPLTEYPQLLPNSSIDAFMAQFPREGLTFDDVSLSTNYADILPHETDIRSRFSRRRHPSRATRTLRTRTRST